MIRHFLVISARKNPETSADAGGFPIARATVTEVEHEAGDVRILLSLLLGPTVGVLIWILPLGIAETAQKALAIVAFMVLYWITEPVDHGVTAIFGCYLFWALGVAKFAVAFGGFANSTPWFLFASMLIGEAASRSGLAKRIACSLVNWIGYSYSRVLLGVIIVSFLLNFFIPSGVARIATLAPIVVSIISAFGVGPGSNVGRGLFIVVTYTCILFDKMILAGVSSILTRGIIEEQTGIVVLWSQWFIAYIPAAVVSVVVLWLLTQQFYQAETKEISGGKAWIHDSVGRMGPWSHEEKKAFFWLLLAISLWATDFIHHINQAVIAVGIGLILLLPQVGLLDVKALKQSNFLPLMFAGGALSMGNVLVQTNALAFMFDPLLEWMKPLLNNPLYAATTLYWSGFLYHFLLGDPNSMLTTSLPALLQLSESQGFNPVALGLIWNSAGGGKLFAYQSSVLILGYSYGYFNARDFIKIGAAMTLVEGILLMILVPLYWPLIGLTWMR